MVGPACGRVSLSGGVVRVAGAGRLAALPCGKVSKWIVLALWIVAVAVCFSPAGKLTGAQENDAVSWLPGNAESTKVLKESAQFSSPDEIPAVLVYERSSGITPADQQAVARPRHAVRRSARRRP